MEPTLILAAEELTWEKGTAQAQGQVYVQFGDQSLTGERAWWDGTTLIIENGVYTREDGSFSFDRAEILLEQQRGTLTNGHASLDGASLGAQQLSVSDTYQAQNAIFEPCSCEDDRPSLLSFSARNVEVKHPATPQAVVILQGGTVRVFDLPILPIPWARVPLNPNRFRVMLPEVSYGTPGWSATIAGKGGLTLANTPVMVTGGPAWRQDRGFRGELFVESTYGKAGVEGGWDSIEEQARGAALISGGISGRTSSGNYRFASDSEWTSDSDYAEDFGVDWVARGVGWRELRAGTSFRGVSLDGWRGDDGSAGEEVRLGVTEVFGRQLQLRPFAAGYVAGAPGDEYLGGQVGGVLSGKKTVGPIYGSIFAGGYGGYEQVRTFDAVVVGDLALALWGKVGPGTLILRPGVSAGFGSGLEGESLGPGRVGPMVEVRLGVPAGALGARGTVFWEAGELAGALRLDASVGALTAGVDVEAGLARASLQWSEEQISGGVFTTRSEDIWFLGGSGSVRVRRVRMSGGVSGDLVGGGLGGVSLGGGYDDGCSLALVTVGFSPDRVLPDVGFQLVLRK